MEIKIVADSDLKKFEEKLIETSKKYNVDDVDTDIIAGIFVAKFYTKNGEKV